MNQITPLLYKRPEIQSQIAKGSFEPILFGTSAVPGMSDAAWAAMLVTVAAPLAMPTMGLSFLPVVGDRIINGDADRPIGLIPSGIADVGFVFPNRMVVLTREIIEAALAPQGPGNMPAAIGPPYWPRFPKPGVMMIPFHDGAYPNDFKALWRPAYYEMYLKVERLP